MVKNTMRLVLCAAAGALLAAAGMAWAANAPVYNNADGTPFSAQGVVIVNPDGSFGALPAAASMHPPAGSQILFQRSNNATVYPANSVVGPAGASAVLQFTIGNAAGEYRIIGTKLQINSTAPISGETSYALYCYSASPPSALADNAPFDVAAVDQAVYLGKIPLGSPIDEGSTLSIETDFVGKTWTLTGTSIWCYLTTFGTYTPVAQRPYQISLHAVGAS